MTDETALAVPSGVQPESHPSQQPSPVQMVRDAMATRWKWMLLVAFPTAALASLLGYMFAPVKYSAWASIKVESKPEALLGSSAELEKLSDPLSYMQAQRMLVEDPGSLRFIEQWVRDGQSRASIPVSGRDRAAEIRTLQALFERERGSDPVGVLEEGLKVEALKNTTILQVQFTDADPKVPAAVVNAIVDAYMENRIPDSELQATRRMQELRDVYAAATRSRESLDSEKEALLRDSPFGTAALAPLIADRVERLEGLRNQVATVQADLRRIADSAPLAENGEPPAEALVEPTLAELEATSPELIELQSLLVTKRADFQNLKQRYRPGHGVYERVAAELARIEGQLQARTEAARDLWRLRTGQTRTYGELKKREEKLTADITSIRSEVDRLNEVESRLQQINRRIQDAVAREREVGQELASREVNSRSVREGRIAVSQWAVAPTLPDSDKRVQISVVAGIGALVAVFGAFFMWGRVSPRAFSLMQFSSPDSAERLLGPLPDLTDAPDAREATELVTNCVHRLRNKIESRRTTGDGYAIMVSSPLQGDGKTTVAMALATSYAASGQSTLLVDCDFIGRALSHQYRLLHAKGVREVLRRGSLDQEVYPSGVEGLSVMPNGVDPSFTAANVQAVTLRRLIRTLRDRFQVLIVDCGPMTASVEAQPVAASCDGAVLTIRRGRSRLQLDLCIRMIREAGAEYLGLVLNYADYGECLEFGSISKMSTDVSRALEDKSAQPPQHPVLEALGGQGPQIALQCVRSNDAVVLAWACRVAGAAGYRVLRSTSGGERWEVVVERGAGESTYIDPVLLESPALQYRVLVLSASGVEIASSPSVGPRA